MLYEGLTRIQYEHIKQKIDNFTHNSQLKGKKSDEDLGFDTAEITMHVEKIASNNYNVTIHGDVIGEFAGRQDMIQGKYRLIGKLNRSVTSQNSLVRNLFTNDLSDEKKFKELSANIDYERCDCCGSRRNRDEIYIIANVNNGEWKQVGTSCVRDVCKQYNLTRTMAEIDEIAKGVDKKIESESKVAGKMLLEPRFYTACALAVSHFGFVSLGTYNTFKKHAEQHDAASTYDSSINVERNIKASMSSNESSDNVGVELRDSHFTEWTKALYRLCSSEYDFKNKALYNECLSDIINIISDGEYDDVMDYIYSDEVQSYVSEILDNTTFDVDDKSVTLEDKLFDYDLSEMNQHNLYVQSAGETIVQAISNYVDSNPKKCGVVSFFYNEMKHNNQKTSYSNGKYKVISPESFTGVDYKGQQYTIDLDDFRMFCPGSYKPSKLVSLVNDGEIVIPEHNVSVCNCDIVVPMCVYTRTGHLCDSDILISSNGKFAKTKNGEKVPLLEFIEENSSSDFTYDDIVSFTKEYVERKKSKTYKDKGFFVNNVSVAKTRDGNPFAKISVPFSFGADGNVVRLFDMQYVPIYKNGSRNVTLDQRGQQANILLKNREYIIKYSVGGERKVRSISANDLQKLHNQAFSDYRNNASRYRTLPNVEVEHSNSDRFSNYGF